MITRTPPVLFSYAFRAFFLAAGIQAVCSLVAWIAGFHGLRWPAAPAALTPTWHAHELVIGFAGAVVAGFLLTAVATWTGRAPLRGAPLAGLAAAWLAGRLASVFAGALPPAALALLDLLFPVLLAVLATREIVLGGSRRNYGIAAITWALALLTALYHAGAAGLIDGGDWLAVTLSVHLLAMLVVVVGGRVIPLFTANWLRLRGDNRPPVPWRWLDYAGIGLLLVAALADSLAPGSAVAGVACLLAGGANLWRLAGWRGTETGTNPLLWVMHAAFAALCGGYLLLGAAAFDLPLARSAALHLLTVGGIAGMILAMMTRVALGHTGRPLAVSRPIVAAYLLLGAAALARSLGTALPGAYLPMIDLAALLWIAAFAVFLGVYAPILVRPRPDQPA
ncbi:MAG: NnrS family protein [Gammaproteobacteria bacterium]|nr:NnrS family protein [Gammaproteobacteria bacterium]